MRILVVGAGAIGGYLGGRLLEAGRDVTFLVRPRRAAELAGHGLHIRSSRGDVDLAAPKTVTADRLNEPYDLVMVSCKAYDLDEAMNSFAPAVASTTTVLPLLNGMRHLDALKARFGPDRVIGGLCFFSATRNDGGTIELLADTDAFSFGELDGARSSRIEAIAAEFAGVNFEAKASESILQDMWEKWVFIATAAGMGCLMRGSVGDIVAGGAAVFATALLEECAAIATSHGYKPSDASMQRGRTILTMPGLALKPSMLRDIERGARTEGDHIVGDLLQRAGDTVATPLLRLANAHLNVYEAVRKAGLS
jgi:2-dehydropantoate 2-reductase